MKHSLPMMHWLFLVSMLLSIFSGIALGQSGAPARDELPQSGDAAIFASPSNTVPPTPTSNADVGILYDNGPFITHPGGGAGGADASAITTGLNTYGVNHSGAPFRVSDDFTITNPAGWQVDSISFFSYQTQAVGGSTTSTYTRVSYQVWDGPPNSGLSTVVFGDTSTNSMISTYWSGVWRVTSTTLTNTQRGIMRNTVSVNQEFPTGTYWLDWFSNGTIASGPWANPIAIPGQLPTGNALQYTGATWQQIRDSVSPNPGNQQGIPFIIYGRQLPSIGTFCRNNVNLSVPDNTPAGVSDDLIVSGIPANQGITSLSVKIDTVNHTYVGDFIMTLSHGGVTRTLMNRPGTGTFGSGGDNFRGTIIVDTAGRRIDSIAATGTPPNGPPYTGYFRPDSGGAPSIAPSSLAPFNGQDPNGTWTLHVSDNAAQDTGRVQAWCLIIEYSPATSVEPHAELPETYILKQNYPNPFNPSTTIEFALPQETNVTLKIYNILGQEVTTLVNGLQTAGTHSVEWDGRNSAGSSLSSGVYFYSIKATSESRGSTFTDMKKMLLIK